MTSFNDNYDSDTVRLCEEAIESGRSPEEVCVGRPDLLPGVRNLES